MLERKFAFFVSERMKLASMLTAERMQYMVADLQNYFPGLSSMSKVDCLQTVGKKIMKLNFNKLIFEDLFSIH